MDKGWFRVDNRGIDIDDIRKGSISVDGLFTSSLDKAHVGDLIVKVLDSSILDSYSIPSFECWSRDKTNNERQEQIVKHIAPMVDEIARTLKTRD